MATANSLTIHERADIQETLAAGDPAAHDPVERTAVQKLVHPLRNHPCAVELLDRMAEPPLFGEAKFDPLLQLFGRLAADTQFYEMKGHGPRFAQMRVWVNAALVNNRAEIRNGGGGTARNRSAAESAFHHVDG